MIRVDLKRESGVLSLVLDGHAGAGNHGSDIVCAAASMLAYTLANAVHKRHGEGKLRAKPILALTSGSATIVCVPTNDSAAEIDMIFDVIADGYRMLSKAYPGNVVFFEKTDASPDRA